MEIVEIDVDEINVDELERRLAAGATLLDVREDDEWQQARVAGAVHIPLSDVPDRVEEVAQSSLVHVICARGGRSAAAVEWLRANEVDAVNVAGGIVDWLERGKPVATGSG